jgi:hypothetical protein
MPRSSLPRARTLVFSSLALALPLLFGCRSSAPGEGAEGDGEARLGEQAQQGAVVAKITKIRGGRGVSSPALPEGAFLGEGAALHAGALIELPRGTRAELELAGGQRLRLDEDSRLRLPKADGAATGASTVLELERGRLVVLGGELEVVAADDRLTIERGEVQVNHAGDTRHYGVVQGRALLHTAGRTVPLGPGASISTPAAPSTRPETPPDPTILAAALVPELSLAPLHESAWTADFERSARIADELPQGVGSLVARRAGSSVERQSLRLTEQKVEVTIAGRIARTEIEQAFHNDSSQTLEGIYQFPLPSDASISDLQLLVGNTWMRGEMLEKQRARQIFRQIVDATVPRDPALLQWEQGSVFKLNIFPIPGKGERRIKIAYTQVLPTVGDALRYRYPMGGSGATATEIGDFQFNVTIKNAGKNAGDAGEAGDARTLGKVTTPMAELARSMSGADLHLAMAEQDYQPTHELGVDIPLAADQGRVIAATHRDRDGQGYFMLTLRPEFELRGDRRPVHYAFVLDRSHGTTPELWTAAEGMTKALLSTLEPDDRFTVLACDTACDRLDGGLRRAEEPAAAGDLDRFLRAQVLAGASDVGAMLQRGAASLDPELGRGQADEVERIVVYLGDGVPTSGALTPDELGELARTQLGGARVQAVALGARSDLVVLDNLVRQTGGDLMQVDARDDLEALARELRLRASVPAARDLALELPPGLIDVHPKAIPALRPGDSLTLVGKLADGDSSLLRGDVRLHGRSRAGEVDERFQIMLDAEYSTPGSTGVHAHLPRTWAQHEITELTQTAGAAASEQIVALSREYNVLSRFTALLVLENDRMYREFNVARKATDKDAWTKESEESEDSEVASEATATPSAEPMAPAEFEPGSASDFDPLAPAQERSRSDFAEHEAFDDEAIGGFDGSDAQGMSGGGSASASSPTKQASKPTSNDRFAPPPPGDAKKKSAKPQGDMIDILDPSASSGSRGWGGWNDSHWQRRQPRLVVRDAGGPSSSDRNAIVALQAARDADPSNRKAHRDLVRRALRSGHEDLPKFAAAWAAADPDHAPALLANADALARAGEPLAPRAYASAVDVEPFSTTMHSRMAEAHALAGDFERACSHRRALVSIDPSNGAHAAALVECLVGSGRSDEARDALDRARASVSASKGKQALTKAEKLLASGVVAQPNAVHSRPELRVELRWTAAENLDIALVDSRGRRLSVLRPQGVRVKEQRDGAERVEVLTLPRVTGTVFVEVTRAQTGSRSDGRVPATLTIKAGGSRTQRSLVLDPGSRRVASVRWDQR